MIRVLRTAAFAAFALLLSLPSAGFAADGAAADPVAASLLAKHRAFMGWSQNDKAPKTLRIAGDIERGDKVIRKFETLRQGGIYVSNEVQLSGFTGRVFWISASDTGFLIQPSGDSARILIAEDIVESEAISEMPAKVVRSEVVDGTPTTVVRVAPDFALPIEIAIVPETGAFKSVTIDPDDKYQITKHVLAYSDITGGRKIVSAFSYNHSTAVYKYTKIEPDVEISASELHPPEPTASWTFGPPDARVPLRVTENRLRLTAKVNGIEGHFILDTGASTIAFTDSFARRVGAKKVGETHVSGIASYERANEYSVESIAFGQNVLHNTKILTGLDENGPKGEEEEDGLIGFGLLGGALVQANLDDGYLLIQDPTKLQPDTASGVTVRVDVTNGTPRVPMTISGRVPVLATLDSGDSFYMLFSRDVISHDHVVLGHDPFGLIGQTGGTLRIYGINGYEDDPCGNIDTLSLGPIVYRHAPGCASPSYSHNDVLVGFDFVKHFNYVFDYPEGIIVMTPRKGEQ